MRASQNSKAIVSFVLLFVLYHLAEYFILFQNNAVGFLGFQFLFFVTAFFLGRWYNGEGLGAWGLSFKGKKRSIVGVVIGVVLYGIPFVASLLLGIEEITYVPDFVSLLKGAFPFAFGVLFSSFSEDVFTRGVIFAHLKAKISPHLLILFSAVIYLLNHIYRLDDGPDTLLYLFLLGIVLCIPLVFTKNLWLTGFIHWSGNTFFFVTHQLIQTETQRKTISVNYYFAAFLLLFIPVEWVLMKRLRA
jgi:membrane protease YdiL (CAAX protease family)